MVRVILRVPIETTRLRHGRNGATRGSDLADTLAQIGKACSDAVRWIDGVEAEGVLCAMGIEQPGEREEQEEQEERDERPS